MKVFLALLLVAGYRHCASSPFTGCNKQNTSSGFVCACNAEGCDDVPPPPTPTAGIASIVQSSKAGDVLSRQPDVAFSSTSNSSGKPAIVVSSSFRFQKLLGFGGAFTDAATMNVMNLSIAAQDLLVKSYYSDQGLRYSIGRIPIASCDFSTHEYSYDDYPDDFDLTNFSLAAEDVKFKIPLLQRAVAMSSVPVRLFGSPWSAPAWMKTNGEMHGRGQLKGEAGDKYHKTWAMYFVRFVQEYAKNNLTIWGITVQNEPFDGEIPLFPFQCMYYSAEMERDFIKKDLGPTLRSQLQEHVNIMIMDDQRIFLPKFAQTVLSDSDAAQYVDGVAVHWYLDDVSRTNDLSATHKQFPNYFILSTEACEGSNPLDRGPDLGSWAHGESYAHDIIADMNNWVAGWVDWNLALDMRGGPNWVKNFVDSPILVDAEKGVFYKQPMYYVLAHFSAFVPPGSIRIASHVEEPLLESNLESVAFVTESQSESITTVVVLNRHDSAQTFMLHDAHRGYAEISIPGHAIQTVRYFS